MKIALITGGATGIGAECCIRLAKDGYYIVLNHLDQKEKALKIKHLVEKFKPCMIINADITKESAVRKMSNYVQKELGLISALVNNAGLYPRRSFEKLDLEFWNMMIEINLTSHYICSNIFSKHMLLNGQGSIVNIGSILSKIGRKELMPYISAKAGLEGLTKSLAIELGNSNIRANCILPGSIEVDMESNVVKDQEKMIVRQLKRQCIKRRGTPRDISNMVSFLVSNKSGFITGQSISIDGGWFFNDK